MVYKTRIFLKLFISFSFATIATLILAMNILNYYIQNSYQEKLIYSAEQSFVQATTFLENYTDTMVYVSDMLYFNADLQEILSSEDFQEDRDGAGYF